MYGTMQGEIENIVHFSRCVLDSQQSYEIPINQPAGSCLSDIEHTVYQYTTGISEQSLRN